MKSHIYLLVLIIFPVVSMAQKNFFAEIQNYSDKENHSPTAFIWASKYWKNSKFGTFIFALNSPGYGEFLVGPSYTLSSRNPQKFVEFGIAGGFDSELRTSAYIFFNANPDSSGLNNNRKWQGLLNVEYGKTGYWYLGFVTYGITNRFSIGCHAQSFTGVWGPRLQFQRQDLMTYVTIGRNLEKRWNGALGGVRYYF